MPCRRAQSAHPLRKACPMHKIETAIDIHASARRVWDVLADFERHPDWNPFVRSIQGQAKEGTKLVVRIQPEGGAGMTFRPRVLVARPGSELRWRGRFLVPGLFDGEHYFRIEPTGPNQSRFVHGEVFSGVFVRFAQAGLEKGTKAGFHAMNRALKARVEAQA